MEDFHIVEFTSVCNRSKSDSIPSLDTNESFGKNIVVLGNVLFLPPNYSLNAF